MKKTLATLLRVGTTLGAKGQGTADAGSCARVLVVDTASIGDMVCALPAVNTLRRELPCAEFSFVVAGNCAELFYPLVEGTNGQVYALGGKNIFALWRGLRGESFDAVLVLSYSLANSFVSLLPHSAVRCGFVDFPDRLDGGKERFAPDAHLSLIRFQAVASFLAKNISRDTGGGFFPLNLLAARHDPYHDGKQLRVLFAPFSKWESKNWPFGRWVELAKWILGEYKSARIYVTAHTKDSALVEELCSRVGWQCASIVKESQGLGALCGCVKGADIVFGVDSAVLHFAGAFDRPRVGLYGPTAPEICSPAGMGGKRQVLVRPDVLPEKLWGGNLSGWQKDSCRKYMQAISVEKVQTKSRLLLNSLAGV